MKKLKVKEYTQYKAGKMLEWREEYSQYIEGKDFVRTIEIKDGIARIVQVNDETNDIRVTYFSNFILEADL